MNAFSFAKEMGEKLHRHWEREMFNIDVFPSLARQAITNFNPAQELKIFDIPFELIKGKEIPHQRENKGSSFGQPPLTLYVSEDKKFFIEIYLWSSVDMTIHDHPFSGAFTIIEGTCRHDIYTFDKTGGTRQLQTGVLTLKESELLSHGNCREIFNGDRLIHRNLHLSRPTVTFIIRTFKEPGFTGLIFEESGLAVAPDLNQVESKFLDYLEGVLQLNKNDMAYQMVQFLAESDCCDYSKYRAAQIYLEYTRNYHQIDLLSSILNASISDVDVDTFRNTFFLHKSHYLMGHAQ